MIDFGVIKSILCEWLENEWDHKFLLWQQDPLTDFIENVDMKPYLESFVLVPFNPTAENIAKYLVEEVAPYLFEKAGLDVKLTKLKIEETRKCSAIYEKD